MEKAEKDALLEEMMLMYGNELVRLAFCYVKNAEVAKDITQNVFIKCYHHIHTFRFDAHVKTWLYRITINECKDYLKSWHYKMVQMKSFMHDTVKSVMPSAEKAVIQKYNNAELKDMIFSLPHMYREVIYLYYYHSFTSEEIAHVLGISVNTVKTRLRRAKQRLGTLLQEAEVNG